MKKIIIEYCDDIKDIQILQLIIKHIEIGKISDNGNKYCYVTTTKNEEICCDYLKSGTIKFCVNKL